MAKRKTAEPRTRRKITLTLSAETDEKLTIQARRERMTRSSLADDLLGYALRQFVVSIRGVKSGEGEAAA
jgi:hypothetical protein